MASTTRTRPPLTGTLPVARRIKGTALATPTRGVCRTRGTTALLRGLRRGRGDAVSAPDVAYSRPPLEDADSYLRVTSACWPWTVSATALRSLPRRERYAASEFARDCLAVMDATGTERAVMVSISTRRPVHTGAGADRPRAGAGLGLHRSIVSLYAVALVGAAAPTGRSLASRPQRPLPAYLWWGHMNPAHWHRDYREFAEWLHLAASRSRTRARPSSDGVGGRWTPTPRR